MSLSGYGENGAKPFRRFKTVLGEIDWKEHATAFSEIRLYYDQYRREKLNKILKKAGIVTAVGVSLVSLITGLSLGLKRKGHDLINDSKKTPWSKLENASGGKTPWSELENASGRGLIILGDNIYLVIGGVCVGVYLYKRKKKNKISVY